MVWFCRTVLALLVIGASFPAYAQARGSTTKRKPASKWEIEFHGGGVGVHQTTLGRPSLPKPGTTRGIDVLFSDGTNLTEFISFTRSVPSWFFGDGSALVNAVNDAGHYSSTRLVPIDPILTTAQMRHQGGGVFGVRLARSIGDRLAVAISFDSASTGVQLSDAAIAGIETSRSTFETFWKGVLNQSRYGSQQVSALAAIDRGSRRELSALGTFEVEVLTRGRSTWFGTAGGGVVLATQATPSFTLTGHYQFLFDGLLPYDESDSIRVHLTAPKYRGVIAWGGGWKWALSSRWGFRAELRATSGPYRSSTTVSATPKIILQSDRSKASAIPIGSVPGVVFNNDATLPNSSLRSSLNNTSMPNFTTFALHGWRTDLGFLVGLSRRF